MCVDEEINKLVGSLTADPAVQRLLEFSVARVLRKASSKPGFDFPEKDKLEHVADWLRAAIHHGEEWLLNTDHLGRPKKLLKFSSFADILKEADKAMRKTIAKAGVSTLPANEQLLMELDDGYRLVKLLDKGALVRESAQMQHCVGAGGYDYVLSDQSEAILSLRDRHNKAHVTLHVSVNTKKLLQLKGKQNKDPQQRYLDLLWPYLQNLSKESIDFGILGFVVDDKGKRHELTDLPENVVIDGNLTLTGSKVRSLPNGVHVKGSLNLKHSNITRLPSGMRVDGDLRVPVSNRFFKPRFKELPSDLVVGGSLVLFDAHVRTIPGSIKARSILASYSKVSVVGEGLYVERDLHLGGCPIKEIPKCLSVGGRLALANTRVSSLHPTIKFGGLDVSSTQIAEIPSSVKQLDYFSCRDSKVKSLPINLSVNGCLDISGTEISSLPIDMRGVTNLVAYRSKIAYLPSDMTSLSDLQISDTLITEIPDTYSHLRILDAQHLTINKMPRALTVEHANLRGSRILSFPSDFTVVGNLQLEQADIETIPSGTQIGGFLDVSHSSLKSISDNVSIGRGFYAANSALEHISDNVCINVATLKGAEFDVAHTRLKALPDIAVKFESVDVSGTDIEIFPEHWKTRELVANSSKLRIIKGFTKNLQHTNFDAIDFCGREFKIKKKSSLLRKLLGYVIGDLLVFKAAYRLSRDSRAF